MRVIIRNQEYYVENGKQAVSQIMQHIQEATSTTGLLYSHIVVDGVEVFHNPEQYLAEHVHDIDTVSVQLMSVEELYLDIMQTTQEYVGRAIPQMGSLIDDFYGVPTEETWTKLAQLIEALQWFCQTELFINGMNSLPEWGKQIQSKFRFSKVLVQLNDAIEQQDTTLIADTLQYEVLPRFEGLSKSLQNYLNEEVMQHDVN